MASLHEEFKRYGDRVETLLQETLSIANITKKKIVLLTNEHREILSESSQNYLEVALEALLNLVKRKFVEIEGKIDAKSLGLMSAQQSFIDTCHRLQEDEERIELRISFILEKILDTCDNRSVELSSQVKRLLEEIETQGKNMAKNVAHTNSLVVKLDEKTSSKSKHMETAISFVAESSHEIQGNIQDLQSNINLLLNGTKCAKAYVEHTREQVQSEDSESYDKLKAENEMAENEDFNDEEVDTESGANASDTVKAEDSLELTRDDKCNEP